jgi:hypothetical protein
MMGFSGFEYLTSDKMREGFAHHLGFPSYFRIELAIAKLIGCCVLLLPLPEELKEWAYAGFTIDLVSAVIAHASVGDGIVKVVEPVSVVVVFAVSYISHRYLGTKGEIRIDACERCCHDYRIAS